MTDLRLTFSADGLAAVSTVLLEMGIGFRVEPVSSAREAGDASSGRAEEPRNG